MELRSLKDIYKTLSFKTLPFNSNINPKINQIPQQFTSLLSKDYPYFSYTYRINSKTQTRSNPNSLKSAHFPINNYYNLHFARNPKNKIFPTIPHTYFSSKYRTTFNFIEVFTDVKPDICSTIIQNSTNHIATLPKGQIGYIEVPITNEQPKYYQINHLNTLVPNVAHTYHPDITDPLSLSRYNTPTQDLHSLSNLFPLHQITMTSPPYYMINLIPIYMDLTPGHYLIQHWEVLPHQKHDSHPILADYGTDQFAIRINDKLSNL